MRNETSIEMKAINDRVRGVRPFDGVSKMVVVVVVTLWPFDLLSAGTQSHRVQSVRSRYRYTVPEADPVIRPCLS